MKLSVSILARRSKRAIAGSSPVVAKVASRVLLLLLLTGLGSQSIKNTWLLHRGRIFATPADRGRHYITPRSIGQQPNRIVM
jgi:hypothetical protein